MRESSGSGGRAGGKGVRFAGARDGVVGSGREGVGDGVGAGTGAGGAACFAVTGGKLSTSSSRRLAANFASR
jgi:hypothetical protein